MKKIVALLITVIMICFALVSCFENLGEVLDYTSESRSKKATTSASESSDTEESSDETTSRTKYTESEEEEEFVPPADQGAKLVGFCTEASKYDGVFDSSGWTAAGMGYFIRTESGSLIVIDGGNTEDAVKFYKLLKKYSLTEHITVDYWILTHPHSDHVNCLIEMSEYKYMMDGMTIKNLVYDFPTKLKEGTDASTSANYKEKFDGIAQQIGANVIQPQKNQKIELSDATIEFLYVPSTKSGWGNKYEYESLTKINQLSLIFTVTTSKKIMFTGDAFERSLESVYNAYRWSNSSALDCDILQMPHHFLCDTGYKSFYDKVNAETLLLPACKSGYEAMKNSDEYKDKAENKINLAAESKAEKVYKAFEGDFEIDI